MNTEVIKVRTPHADRPPQSQAFTNTSSAAKATGISVLGDAAGGWFSFTPTQNCHVRFGTSSVAAATTDDMFFAAGARVDLWLSRTQDTHLTVIRSSADGVLHWHRSDS